MTGTNRVGLRDALWTVVAAAFGALLLVSIFGGGWLLWKKPDWPTFVDVPANVLFCYWIAMGAWFRTQWGKRWLLAGMPPPAGQEPGESPATGPAC